MKKLHDFLPKFEEKKESEPRNSKSQTSKDFILLIINWKLVVGEKMSQFTRPLRMRQETLSVASLDPVYSSQLVAYQDEIIRKIHHHFPRIASQIKKLNFVTTNRPFAPLPESKLVKEEPKSDTKQEAFHPYDPVFIKEKQQWAKLLGNEVDQELVDLLASLNLQMANAPKLH